MEKKEVIKQVKIMKLDEHGNKGMVVLRTDSYGNSLAFFDYLFAEAKKDFPNLERENVQVTHYAGTRFARTFGIEFKATNIPSGYDRIRELEQTF